MTNRIDPPISAGAGTPRPPQPRPAAHPGPTSGWLPGPGASATVGDTLVEASSAVGLYVLRRVS